MSIFDLEYLAPDEETIQVDLVDYPNEEDLEEYLRYEWNRLYGPKKFYQTLTDIDQELISSGFIDKEGKLSEEFYEYAEYSNRQSAYGDEVILAAAHCEVPAEHIEEAYAGEFDTPEEQAEELFRDCYEIPVNLERYIDWKSVAYDLAQDYDNYEGHYFARNY